MSEPIRDGRRLDSGAVVGAVFGGIGLGMVYSAVIGLAMLMILSPLAMSENPQSYMLMDWWSNWLIRVDWLRSLVDLTDPDAAATVLLFLWAKGGLVYLITVKPVSMLINAKYALPSGTDSMTGRLVAWVIIVMIFINPPGWITGAGAPFMFNLDAITYAGALHVLGGAYDVIATYKRSPWA